MRLPTAILLAVIALCGALGAYGWTLAAPSRRPVAQPTLSGMAQLAAYQCAKPERKVVLIHGVEDGFSPAGDEPLFIRAERRTASLLSFTRDGSYDQTQTDIGFADSLEMPARVVRGLFVTGLRPMAGSASDYLMVGDIPTQGTVNATGRAFRSLVLEVAQQRGWRVNGEVYSAELQDLPFFRIPPGPEGRPRTVLELLRSRAGQNWVDVSISDDTSVDFIGMALCVAPAPGKGMTYYQAPPIPGGMPGMVVLGCNGTRDDRAVCDPYEGDTPCDTPLPVACLRPDEAPMPADLAKRFNDRIWTGGTLAATPPTPASRFRTVGQADAYCARTFGPRWRVLAAHDGLGDNAALGRGDKRGFEPRVWVDIADQPYANCWARQ